MFLKATLLGTIKDAEGIIIQSGSSIVRDGANKIIRIHIFGQLEDTTTPDKKQFDFLIEGEKLDAIRGNIRAGVTTLFKEKAKLNYDDWSKDLIQAQQTTLAINDADIQTQFGIKEVTVL